MALLNSKKYAGLDGYGTDQGQQRPQTFKKVFITGEPRKEQKVGQMQCMQNFDEGTYIINNAETINLVPMFFKKIREGYDDKQKKNPKLIYFSWNPAQTDNYPPEAKQAYIIAGAALDANMKPIPKPDEPGKTALIYFKCDGSKFGSVIEFLNAVNDATAKLPAISDDPEFEKKNVSWRRHIIQVTVGTTKTDFGNKYVFTMTPSKLLPDEKVVSFMDQAETLRTKFDEQFDMSNFIAGSKKPTTSSAPASNNTAPTKENKTTAPATEEQKTVTEDLSAIELGI